MEQSPIIYSHDFGAFTLDITTSVVVQWVIIIVLGIVSFLLTRNLKEKPNKKQAAIEYIYETINSLVTRVAKSGSEYERAQNNALRNSNTALNVKQQVSREGDLDFTKAITDLKMLDYTYQATLSNAGKMYSSTLLNYMR